MVALHVLSLMRGVDMQLVELCAATAAMNA